MRVWTAAVSALCDQVRAASTSPPADPAVRVATEHALRGEVRSLGEQFVEQTTHPCHTLAWRLWHFQGERLTCVRQPEVPADNNLAERAIRPLVVGRKISGGTRSPRGSQTRMVLSTLAHTWVASSPPALRPSPSFAACFKTPYPKSEQLLPSAPLATPPSHVVRYPRRFRRHLARTTHNQILCP